MTIKIAELKKKYLFDKRYDILYKMVGLKAGESNDEKQNT